MKTRLTVIRPLVAVLLLAALAVSIYATGCSSGPTTLKVAVKASKV